MVTEKAVLINAMLDVEEKLRLCNEIISELVTENQKLEEAIESTQLKNKEMRELIKVYEELKDTV